MASLTFAAMENFRLEDVIVSSRGSKSAQLKNGRSPVMFMPTDYLQTPFGPCSFQNQETTRMTLEFRCDEETEQFFNNLDEWSIQYISENSERLLRKKLSPDLVAERYHKTLKRHDKYPPLVKTKINLNSQRDCSFWNDQGQKLPEPDWRFSSIKPKIVISGLWIMGSDFGWVCNTTDCLVGEAQSQCPFELPPQE